MSNLSEVLSLGFILFFGFIISFFLNKIRIPGLVGMIIVGLVMGPEVLNLIKDGILNISSELRSIALIIILTRSGLNLDLASLKKIGRPAILMSFLPASFEILGITLGSIWLLKTNRFEGMLLGSVLAAVSPAVVSPRMINLIENKYGEKHNVPKLILAGSSLDDIYVIILFYAFLSLVETSVFDAKSIAGIPISIILGIGLGILVAVPIIFLFKKTNFNCIINVLIVFSVTLMMKGLENYIDKITQGTKVDFISVSGLLGIIVLGIIILYKTPEKSKDLSTCYNSLWKFFEIILFVLVGASLKFTEDLKKNIGFGILVILIGLVFRAIGVIISIIKTEYNLKERIFIVIAYMPKATVQASIGGIAASKGLPCGDLIQAVSIIAIIITAPLGALGIDLLSKVLLEQTTGQIGDSENEDKDKNGVEDLSKKNIIGEGDGNNSERSQKKIVDEENQVIKLKSNNENANNNIVNIESNA